MAVLSKLPLVGSYVGTIVSTLRWSIWIIFTGGVVFIFFEENDPEKRKLENHFDGSDVFLVSILDLLAALVAPASFDPGTLFFKMLLFSKVFVVLYRVVHIFTQRAAAYTTRQKWMELLMNGAIVAFLLRMYWMPEMEQILLHRKAWSEWSIVADDIRVQDAEITSMAFAVGMSCFAVVGSCFLSNTHAFDKRDMDKTHLESLAGLSAVCAVLAAGIEWKWPRWCDYPFAFDPLTYVELIRVVFSPNIALAFVLGILSGLSVPEDPVIGDVKTGVKIHQDNDTLLGQARSGFLASLKAGVWEELLFRFTLHPILMALIYGMLAMAPALSAVFDAQATAYSFLTFGYIDELIADVAAGSMIYISAVHSADLLFALAHLHQGVFGVLIKPLSCVYTRFFLYRYGLWAAIAKHVVWDACLMSLPPLVQKVVYGDRQKNEDGDGGGRDDEATGKERDTGARDGGGGGWSIG